MKKSLLLYVVIAILFGLGIYFTLEHGRHLPPRTAASAGITTPATAVSHAPAASGSPTLWSSVSAHFKEPLTRLFVQLLVILIATRIVGTLFTRIGQPAVVGEMFAGILLGPSLLGFLFPGAFQLIFAPESLGTLKLFSQIGVCLFMFAVGMELDVNHLRSRAYTAVVVSHASILIPYCAGVAISLLLFSKLAGTGISFISFALFMGISMSITAFPVLARILQERGIDKQPLGSTAITCAAVDDVTAWCLLAFVVAIARSTGLATTALSLGLVLAYVAIMLWVVPRQLTRWFGIGKGHDDSPGRTVVTAVLTFAFASALLTEIMGIHALFGAFLAGVVMPKSEKFRHYLRVRIESFSSVFLLPLFFAFTGLRTQIGLLNDLEHWSMCALIIFTATAGKLGGTMFTARLTGMNWNDSFALGALMNTRGLMELIAINIGYDLGILSPEIFAMLVIMALTTTFMTGPLLTLAERFKHRTVPVTAG